MHLKKAKAIA